MNIECLNFGDYQYIQDRDGVHILRRIDGSDEPARAIPTDLQRPVAAMAEEIVRLQRELKKYRDIVSGVELMCDIARAKSGQPS